MDPLDMVKSGAGGTTKMAEKKSLWEKLAEQATDIAGDIARTWAKGTFAPGEYVTYEKAGGGVVQAGGPAPVVNPPPMESTPTHKINPWILAGGGAALLVALVLIFK